MQKSILRIEEHILSPKLNENQEKCRFCSICKGFKLVPIIFNREVDSISSRKHGTRFSRWHSGFLQSSILSQLVELRKLNLSIFFTHKIPSKSDLVILLVSDRNCLYLLIYLYIECPKNCTHSEHNASSKRSGSSLVL